MTYQLSWGADLRRHFYNSCTRSTIYPVGVCAGVCGRCCVSVSDLEFVSMFPSARGECFNGDVATLECSQVENGERRFERLRLGLRVLSATIRIRIRIKRGRLPVSPTAAAAAMEHQSGSSSSVDSALRCFCFDFAANEITYSTLSLSLTLYNV